MQHQEQYINLLRLMIISREKDKRESMLMRQGKGHVQVSSSGHEALLSFTSLLKPNDYLFTYYRGSHLLLGKGVELKLLARDYFAKKNSSSAGRSMSTHFGSYKQKIFPSAAPIASHCLPAIGAAWGQSLDHTQDITICSVGDGATRSGEFYEAVCQAYQFNLPVIFLVEDNHYAISTNTEKFTPMGMGIFDSQLVQAIDGTDAFELLEISKDIIEKTRNGFGPIILWCDVDRIESHTAGDDHTIYRSQNELNSLRDPITKFRDKLISIGLLDSKEFISMQSKISQLVKMTYKKAYDEDEPNPAEILSHLYAEKNNTLTNRIKVNQQIDMVEGTRFILNYFLSQNKKIILFGQDIEDPKGGVFGFTKGLSSKYPQRVINAPIAEATIIGSAIGLAAYGFKPIFEIQFIDFIAPGFNQITSNLSSLRWRSCGEWSAPLVLYAPYGAYLPSGGLWHSQSNECWLTSIPGLKVVVPSTPLDLISMFQCAINGKDPYLILIPKHIFRIKQNIDYSDITDCATGKYLRKGNDITIVCWGNCVEISQMAAYDLAEEGVSCEIIDLRSLVPYDLNIICQSVKKTRRLTVVQEDVKTGSFGATIITDIVAKKEIFDTLYSQPILISRDDIHIPYHSELEYSVLPSTSDVKKAIINMVKNEG